MRTVSILSACLAAAMANEMVIMQESHQDNRHWRRLSRVDGFVPHEIVLATKVMVALAPDAACARSLRPHRTRITPPTASHSARRSTPTSTSLSRS